MSVTAIPKELLLTRGSKWRVYGVILEPNPGDFFVKIGVSSDVICRVHSFRPALCAAPALVYSPATKKSHAYTTECLAHKKLSSHRTFGEWFRFSTEEKSVFHNAVKESWLEGDWRDAFSWSSMGKQALLEAIQYHAVAYEQGRKISASRT